MRASAAAVLLVALSAAAAARTAPAPAAPPPPGPLDPLTGEELARAAAALRGAGLFGPDARFPMLVLQEPAKDEAPRGRQAFAVVYDSTRTETSEAVVDLAAGKLVSWRLIPGAGPRPALPPRQAQAPAPAAAPAPKGKNKDKTPPPPPGPLRGYQASWRGWTFHVAPHPREGLTLHAVSYAGRPVLYRASLAGLVTVSSPAAPTAHLLADAGLAPYWQSLQPGADAPAEASFLDAVFADDAGRPYEVPRALAAFERPSAAGGAELCLVMRAAPPGRAYAFRWLLRDDGELEAQAEVAASSAAVFERDDLAYRLDFDVDGTTNSLSELRLEPSGPVVAPLRSEREAARDAAPAAAAKRWLVTSSSAAPRGWALVPAGAEASARRSGFSAHALWATAYRPEELYAAGDYPGPGALTDGVERWSRRDEPLEQADVVLWPVFGLSSYAGLPARGGLRLVPAVPKP